MLAADLALVPAQPSPFDGWAAAETLRLLHEAQRFRPQLIARFVLNRCRARTLTTSEIAETMAKHEPPALAVRVGPAGRFRGGRTHRTACIGNAA